MDFIATEQELAQLSSTLIELAQRYYDTRKTFGRAKRDLFVLMVPLQREARYHKAALEKQFMMMISELPPEERAEVEEVYRAYIELEQEYKGLEKLIDAYESKISALQSLMKWQRENT